MTTYMRVVNSVVVELYTPPAGMALEQCFSAGIAELFSPVPGGQTLQVGDTYSNGGAAPAAMPTPVLTLAQQALIAEQNGLTISLSGSMTLAATLFPTDDATQSNITAVITTINALGTFPGGADTYPMKDASGTWHTFTVPQYKAVAGAIAAYVSALDLIAAGNPLGATALPSNSVALTV